MARSSTWIVCLVLVALVAAACSTSSNDAPPSAPASDDAAVAASDSGGSDGAAAPADAGDGGTSTKTTGVGTISGPIAGRSFELADVYAELKPPSEPVIVKMRSYVDACAEAQANHGKAGSTEVKLEIDAAGSAAAFPGSGTYPVLADKPDGGSPAFYAKAKAEAFDAACSATTVARGTGGTVTLTSVTSTDVKGTFDVTFPSGRVTGTFAASVCTSPSSTGTFVCEP